MNKTYKIAFDASLHLNKTQMKILLTLFMLCGVSLQLGSETLTVSTFYPAPVV